MTSAWTQPPGRDDLPDGPAGEPDENQLDLFELLPRASTGTKPFAANSETAPSRLAGTVRHPAGPRAESPVVDHAGVMTPPGVAGTDGQAMGGPAAGRDFLDAGVSDADDLRRLEESIRWLMHAGTTPLPPAAPLPSVIGLSPLDPRDDDLLLDPDTLFPPRPARRAGHLAAGAAKLLLVSAIAAPTAYFIASWLQFPGAVTPSDQAAVAPAATPVALSGERAAAASPALSAPAPRNARSDVDPPMATPDRAPAPPAARPAEVAVAALTPMAAAPETAQTAAPEAKATPAAASPVEAASQPIPAAAPAKPMLRREEIAMMVERGRVLFEAGDLAAARLFFRRAANAGDAAAAIAMGATYDPEVLSQRFIRGIEADPEEAQRWYEKARGMGQPQQQRMEMLAQRP